MGINNIQKIGTECADYLAQAAHSDVKILKEYQNSWERMLKSDMNAWIWGQVFWGLNSEQIDKIIEIRSKSQVDRMDVLSELRGHMGDRQGGLFRVPEGLYRDMVKGALINKLKFKLKYGC